MVFLKVYGKPTPPLANTYGGIIVLGVEKQLLLLRTAFETANIS